ncbi:MAG TPA: response regulator transcription factor [Firmicutes bacterium]|nr:response regulator transcription factor [Candidatus Fermentithermobacillaceae bacterium]
MEENVKPRILVVEDEASLARFLQLELNHEGYQVEIARDGYEALARINETGWDLILLDLMLPGLEGFEVCRRVREKSDVPIIMLTARDAMRDKIKGLDMGADDYITKPFAVEELLARIRARLRRAGTQRLNEDKLIVSDLVICRKTRQVTRGGKTIPLTRREFDLLAFLAENAGIVLSRETILNRVWGFDYYGNTNVVDVYIRYLRAKIDEPFPTRLLHTVRGVGYTLREEE